jgi:ABC-type uncharacterized transport system permease subunit
MSVVVAGWVHIEQILSSSFRESLICSMVASALFCRILPVTSNIGGREEKIWVWKAISEIASLEPTIWLWILRREEK